MVDYLLRVTFEGQSGLPHDRFINAFTFQYPTDTPLALDVAALFTAVQEYYNVPTVGASISDYISNEVSRSEPVELLLYKFPASPGPIGSPVAEGSFTLGPTSDLDPLPGEVAVVNSFHALLTNVPEETGNTRPAARRRGRLYHGPLNVDAVESPGTKPVVAADLVTAITIASAGLGGASPSGFVWTVFSRADWIGRPVVAGYVDNAFDTQRRRGNDPTGRTTWVA